MLILTNKVLNCLSENIENENFFSNNIDNEIVISFKASNKKVLQIEKNHLKKDKNEKLKYIRGNVEIKTLISNNFGFPLWKVYFIEKNVSFNRFFNMVENMQEKNFSEKFSKKNKIGLFFSY